MTHQYLEGKQIKNEETKNFQNAVIKVQGLQAFTYYAVTVNDEKKAQGLNSKSAYTPNFVRSSGLKATGIFVKLLSQNGFESDSPERKS